MPGTRSMKLYEANAPTAMNAAVPSESWPGVAGQDVEPERGERQDQERNQDAGEHVRRGDERNDDERDEQRSSPIAIRSCRIGKIAASAW